MLVAQAKYAVELFLNITIDDAKIAPVEEKIALSMEQKN